MTTPLLICVGLCVVVLTIRRFRDAPLRSARLTWRFFALVALLLSPACLFWSVPAALLMQRGGVVPGLVAAALVYGVPVVLCLAALRWSDDQVSTRIVGLALTGGSIVFCFLLLEAGTRILGEDPARERPWRRQEGTFMRPSRIPGLQYELIPNNRWRHVYSSDPRGASGMENAIDYHTNPLGFRDGEFSPVRTPGIFRIALLGDSFGFGEGVRAEASIPDLLESMLKGRRACPVEVYNFAVPGYSTRQEAVLLEHTVLSYRPDLVVVWYFLNDLESVGTLEYLGVPDRDLVFPSLQRVSVLARITGARFAGLLMTRTLVATYLQDYREDSEKWTSALLQLERIGEAGRRAKIPVLLFVHPVLHRLDHSYPFEAAHGQVVSAARARGITAFDLLAVLRGKRAEDLWVHPADQHPNEIANHLTAGFAARTLSDWLPACP